jgi:hypothetical protein
MADILSQEEIDEILASDDDEEYEGDDMEHDEAPSKINYLLWFQYIAIVILTIIGLFANEAVATQYYLTVGLLIGKLGFDYNAKKKADVSK